MSDYSPSMDYLNPTVDAVMAEADRVMGVLDNYLKPTVSGLWEHSHKPESDLMKQYVVERRIVNDKGEARGWLAIASFDDINAPHKYAPFDDDNRYRCVDQFNGNDVVWEDK